MRFKEIEFESLSTIEVVTYSLKEDLRGRCASFRLGCAELILTETEASNDLLDTGFVSSIEGGGLAHDEETLEMPAHHAAAVIGDQRVLRFEHGVPGLLIGHTEISGGKVDCFISVAGSGVGRADPHFSAIGCRHVEEGGVVNLFSKGVKVLLGAIPAVVGRVISLNNVPRA